MACRVQHHPAGIGVERARTEGWVVRPTNRKSQSISIPVCSYPLLILFWDTDKQRAFLTAPEVPSVREQDEAEALAARATPTRNKSSLPMYSPG